MRNLRFSSHTLYLSLIWISALPITCLNSWNEMKNHRISNSNLILIFSIFSIFVLCNMRIVERRSRSRNFMRNNNEMENEIISRYYSMKLYHPPTTTLPIAMVWQMVCYRYEYNVHWSWIIVSFFTLNQQLRLPTIIITQPNSFWGVEQLTQTAGNYMVSVLRKYWFFFVVPATTWWIWINNVFAMEESTFTFILHKV